MGTAMRCPPCSAMIDVSVGLKQGRFLTQG
jgi:hypothetical protein